MSETRLACKAMRSRLSIRDGQALVRGVEERGQISAEECLQLCALAADPSVFRWRLRADACRALRLARHDPDLADRAARTLATIVELGQDLNTGCAVQFVTRWLIAGLGFVVLFMLVFGEPSGPRGVENVLGALTSALLTSVLPVAAATLAIEVRRLSSVRLKALEAMHDLAQPGSAPVVLKACFHAPWSLCAAARRAAEPILRAIPSVGYGLYGSAVPDMARLALDSQGALRLACVEALERVGDGRALESMQKLAARLEGRGADVDVDLREAVSRAVAVLTERRRREGDVSRLVRPAMRPDDEGLLLRPAGPTSPGEDRLLLRPAGDAGEDEAPEAQLHDQAETRRARV